MTKRRDRPDDELLTVREAAEEFKLNPETIARWVRKGALPAVRVGPRGKRRVIRIRRADLVEVVP